MSGTSLQHTVRRRRVWFGFVRAALLPAVGTCVVLAFGAMPGRCCFLRVTQYGAEESDSVSLLRCVHICEDSKQGLLRNAGDVLE